MEIGVKEDYLMTDMLHIQAKELLRVSRLLLGLDQSAAEYITRNVNAPVVNMKITSSGFLEFDLYDKTTNRRVSIKCWTHEGGLSIDEYTNETNIIMKARGSFHNFIMLRNSTTLKGVKGLVDHINKYLAKIKYEMSNIDPTKKQKDSDFEWMMRFMAFLNAWDSSEQYSDGEEGVSSRMNTRAKNMWKRMQSQYGKSVTRSMVENFIRTFGNEYDVDMSREMARAQKMENEFLDKIVRG